MKEQKSTAKKKGPRRASPRQTVTEILVRSRRRCCLCACLENDFSVKPVQIAHIDHNPSNSNPTNLIPLCVPHHDDYDSKRSQTKGITAGEIRHYQSELDKVLQQIDEQIHVQIVGIGRNQDTLDQPSARPSARLLGEVLQAFDEEVLRVQPSKNFIGRATGIKLARLGKLAITEEGDIDVALEAFMSLLRLSNITPQYFSGGLYSFAFPSLTPQLSTVKLLPTMYQDWRLIDEVVRRARIYALIGDEHISTLSHYSEIPNNSWKTVVDIFYHYTKFGTDHSSKDWNGGEIMMCLTGLLVGFGIVYIKRGLKLPDPPTEIRITTSDRRGVEPEQSAEIFPYVYLANKIAMLAKGDFEFVLKRLDRYIHPVTQVTVDPQNYKLLSLEDAKTEILSWTIRPGQENTYIAVRDDESKNACMKLILELQEIGQKVSDSAKAFLISERSCAENQRYFREGTNAPYSCFVNMETDAVGFKP